MRKHGKKFTAARAQTRPAAPYSWRETFFSERGTLIALAIGFLLLYLKFVVLRSRAGL